MAGMERRYDGTAGPFTYPEFERSYGKDAPAMWNNATPGPPAQYDENTRLKQGSADTYGSNGTDSEEEWKDVADMTPEELDIRHGFIVKVYSILTAQVCMTVAFAAACVLVDPAKEIALKYGLPLAIGGGIAALFCIFLLFGCPCCFEGYASSYPTNFVLLFFFTLFESFGIGVISALYCTLGKENILVAAAGATLFIFISLTVYVKFSSRNFSMLGPFLFITLLCCIIFGAIAALFKTAFITLVINVVFILVFIGYILYDTDQILKRTSIAEMCETGAAISGAVDLYLDIIGLFIKILAVMDHFNGD